MSLEIRNHDDHKDFQSSSQFASMKTKQFADNLPSLPSTKDVPSLIRLARHDDMSNRVIAIRFPSVMSSQHETPDPVSSISSSSLYVNSASISSSLSCSFPEVIDSHYPMSIDFLLLDFSLSVCVSLTSSLFISFAFLQIFLDITFK